jgi:hypothetical protein
MTRAIAAALTLAILAAVELASILLRTTPMAKAKDDHWIEHMHMDKGALHRHTHTPAGKDISAKREHAAAHSKNSTIRREAALAATLKSLRK